MNASAFRHQKQQILLKSELQVVANNPTWVLGTEFGSSGRAVSFCNY